VGNFKVGKNMHYSDNIQTLGSCNCALAYANIISGFGKSDNPVIRVFINGFDVSSSTVQISVSPTNLEGTKLTIKITTGAATGLRSIWLSWLAFSPSTATFGSYGGQFSKSRYSGSVSSDISNSLYQSQYVLYGINLISLSQSKPLAFTSAIDSNFVLTVSASSLVDDFSLVYIAVGVLPSQVCSNCGNGLFASGNNCISACPVGSYAFTYKDGGVACRTCSTQLGFILANGKCVQGSVTSSSTTTSTIISAVPAAGSASTSTLAQQGSQSATSSSQSSTAAPIIPVPAPAKPTAATATTVSVISVPTAPTTVINSTISVISTPSAPVLFQPTACPANAYFNGNECECEVGFVYRSGKCQVPNVPIKPVIVISYPTAQSTAAPSASSSTSAASSSTSTASSSTVSTTTTTVAPTPSPVPTASNTSQSSTSSQISSSGACGAYSYNNGLGICVCNQGCYFSNGSCQVGTLCGANS
jgi:hypothetical protein